MMLRYALRTIRHRKAGFLGAFLALMCAAALVTACGTLLETGLRGRIATERYAATPLIVSADQNVHRTTVKHKGNGKTKTKHKAKPVAERAWLPASTADRLRTLPGVRTVVPELTFLAQPLGLPDHNGSPSYGHAWSSAPLTPFALTGGRAPASAGDVVIDRALAARAGLTTGDRITVQSTRAPRTYRVSGIAAPRGRGGLRQQSALFFSAAEAERLADRAGQVTALGVLPEPGTDLGALKQRVRTALDGTTAQVATGDGRGPVEFLDAAGARVKLVSMGGAMGGTSLLVAVLVVVGTFALSIQQRQRELALLRTVAATSRQIHAAARPRGSGRRRLRRGPRRGRRTAARRVAARPVHRSGRGPAHPGADRRGLSRLRRRRRDAARRLGRRPDLGAPDRRSAPGRGDGRVRHRTPPSCRGPHPRGAVPARRMVARWSAS